jgi:hypothetical protein
MAKISTSETGDAKNVANYNKMITACTGYGLLYNPSNPKLAIPAMTTQAANCDAAVKGVMPFEKPYKDAIAARHVPFDALAQLTRNALNELKSCDGVSDTTIQSAETLEKKIAGTNRAPESPIPPVVNPPEPTPKSHSTSQQSFDMRLANFNNFVSLLAAEPNYLTNEDDLTVASLTTYAATLKTVNDAVEPVYEAYETALTTRDTLLYYPATGMLPIAAKVKNYVKGNTKITETAKKLVLDLKFKAPPKADLHF